MARRKLVNTSGRCRHIEGARRRGGGRNDVGGGAGGGAAARGGEAGQPEDPPHDHYFRFPPPFLLLGTLASWSAFVRKRGLDMLALSTPRQHHAASNREAGQLEYLPHDQLFNIVLYPPLPLCPQTWYCQECRSCPKNPRRDFRLGQYDFHFLLLAEA